jgi:hypothetical protein
MDNVAPIDKHPVYCSAWAPRLGKGFDLKRILKFETTGLIQSQRNLGKGTKGLRYAQGMKSLANKRRNWVLNEESLPIYCVFVFGVKSFGSCWSCRKGRSIEKVEFCGA